jgi:hypothetical protein
MSIKNEQCKEFLNLNPNFKYNKENITLKDKSEFSLEAFLNKYGGNYVKLNLDPKTTSFNRFLKDNKVFDTIYKKINLFTIFLNIQVKFILNPLFMHYLLLVLLLLLLIEIKFLTNHENLIYKLDKN